MRNLHPEEEVPKSARIIEAQAMDLEVFENLLQLVQTTLRSSWETLSPRTQKVISIAVPTKTIEPCVVDIFAYSLHGHANRLGASG
jgi:hypothetical protein